MGVLIYLIDPGVAMKQIRFLMILLSLFIFTAQAFGDNSTNSGYSSPAGNYGNAYNRTVGTNRNAYGQHNTNAVRSLQSSRSPGYFPLGSDLRDKPDQHSDGSNSRWKAN